LSYVSDYIGPFISKSARQLYSAKEPIVDKPVLADFSDFEQVGTGKSIRKDDLSRYFKK
jgi:hypothetical protein